MRGNVSTTAKQRLQACRQLANQPKYFGKEGFVVSRTSQFQPEKFWFFLGQNKSGLLYCPYDNVVLEREKTELEEVTIKSIVASQVLKKRNFMRKKTLLKNLERVAGISPMVRKLSDNYEVVLSNGVIHYVNFETGNVVCKSNLDTNERIVATEVSPCLGQLEVVKRCKNLLTTYHRRKAREGAK